MTPRSTNFKETLKSWIIIAMVAFSVGALWRGSWVISVQHVQNTSSTAPSATDTPAATATPKFGSYAGGNTGAAPGK